MDLIFQLTRTHSMDHNQIVLMMGNRQFKIFLKSIQLNSQDLQITQVLPFDPSVFQYGGQPHILQVPNVDLLFSHRRVYCLFSAKNIPEYLPRKLYPDTYQIIYKQNWLLLFYESLLHA